MYYDTKKIIPSIIVFNTFKTDKKNRLFRHICDLTICIVGEKMAIIEFNNKLDKFWKLGHPGIIHGRWAFWVERREGGYSFGETLKKNLQEYFRVICKGPVKS